MPAGDLEKGTNEERLALQPVRADGHWFSGMRPPSAGIADQSPLITHSLDYWRMGRIAARTI